jgi:peroxiredoxin
VLAEDSLGSIFPPLPPDRASLNSNWTATRTIGGGQRTLSTAEPGSTTPNRLWTFDEDVKGTFDAIYLTHEHSQYQFDGREGIVRTATTTTDADWPKPGYHSTSTIELTGLAQLEPEKLAAVAADAEKFFAIRHQYMQLLAQASGDNARCEGFLDQAKSLLNESESQITVSAVRPLLVDMKDKHALSARLILQAVTEKAPLVDKLSAEWKTVDMAGQPHALADYRGKVVVLGFWFRGCRPCIASMPQMKRLVDDFRGQDVVILGVNSDDKDEDAQFVIDKLGLNYSTLKNSYGEEQINVKYKVHGLADPSDHRRQGHSAAFSHGVIVADERTGWLQDSRALGREQAVTQRRLFLIIS